MVGANMTEYKRLAESYEAAKPLIDYARTVTTFFALAAILAVAYKTQFGPPPEKPNGMFFDILFSISNLMFLYLTVSIWHICGRLTYMLFLDKLRPTELEKPGNLSAFLRFVIWLFSYGVMGGAGSLIVGAVSAATA